MTENSTDLTQYLQNWRDGNASAIDEILPLIYNELRQIARRYRSREHGEHTFQTTEIINEAYLKLINQSATDWQNRSHFFAVASRVMRNLLVDYARSKNYQKRGSGAEKVSFDDVVLFTNENRRTALLRGTFRTRNGGSSRRFRNHCQTRMAEGKSVALQ
jgi:RNA polymerase sigma factor (TIGR02999 family)